MIKTENITINGRDFIRTYSDSGYKVERDEVQYDEAIDPIEFNRIYIETNIHVNTNFTEVIEADH